MKAAEVVDMSGARVNVQDMSKMIQVRNVPDEMHRALKVRAASEGMSLSDYIKKELGWVTGKSKLQEVIARSEARGPSGMKTKTIVEILRDSRGD